MANFWGYNVAHLFAGSIKMQFYKDKSSIQSSKNWFPFLRWGKIISLYTPSNTSLHSCTACHYSSSGRSIYQKWSNNGLRCACKCPRISGVWPRGKWTRSCPNAVLSRWRVGQLWRWVRGCLVKSSHAKKIPQTLWVCPMRGRRWLNAISTLPRPFSWGTDAPLKATASSKHFLTLGIFWLNSRGQSEV